MNSSSLQGQVSFMLGKEEYSLPASSVSDIMPVPEINQLPHTADYLLGIIKVKGTIIPIIDLKRKLTGFATHITVDSRLIITDIDYSQVGLLVEKCNGHIDYQTSELEALEDREYEVPHTCVLGITRLGSRTVKMLDTKALLR
jgi:purine-binding chemotaxis protein CheW